MGLYRALINFIDNYRSLFLNPAENAAEIIVSTALIIIGTVILLLLGTMLTRAGKAGLARARTERNFLISVGLYIGAALIFAVFMFSITLPLTSNSSFCGRVCHSMNADFQSWRRSSHAKVACSSCHIDNSLTDLIHQKTVVGVRELTRELRGYKVPINAKSHYSQSRVPNSRCLRCHAPKNRFFSVQLGLNMDHPKHLKAGLRCTTCHNRVAHPQAENYTPIKEKRKDFKYKDYLTMRQGCWRCHREGGKYIDAKGKIHTGPLTVKETGQQAPTACLTCHEPTWKELPRQHKPARGVKWGRGLAHGEEARKDFGKCKGCHEPTVWCATRCHYGVIMPHEKDWVNIHPPKAKRDIKRCYACHKVKKELDFCGRRCHHEPFKKQFNLAKKFAWTEGKEQHGLVVKAAGEQVCLRCHEKTTWCSTQCHKGITMPHAGGWRSEHFKQVEFVPGDGWQRATASCAMCHNKYGDQQNYCSACHHRRYGAVLAPTPLTGLMTYVRQKYGVMMQLREFEGRIDCEDCHQRQWCNACHDGSPDRDIKKANDL